MKRICAWCTKDMGDDGSGEPGTTHGICDECAKKIADKLDAEEKRKKGGKRK